jgi:hypothetical protein
MKVQKYTPREGWHYEDQGPQRSTRGARPGVPIRVQGVSVTPLSEAGLPALRTGALGPLSEALQEAIGSLLKARGSQPHGSPCERSPGLWDKCTLGHGGANESSAREQAPLIYEAMQACPACTVFSECRGVRQALDEESPEIEGVIAGEYVHAGPGGDLIREILDEIEREEMQ